MENKNLKNYQISQNFNYIANLNIYYSQHKTHTSHHNIHHSPPSAYSSGITLVALVVTIIVLLILSSVTISSLLGDDGIIKKAQNAIQTTTTATTDETQALNSLINQLIEETEIKPKIEKIETTSTLNTITLKTYAKNAKNGIYTYYIGSTEEDLEEKGRNETGEYEFNGLTPSTKYYIKVKVETNEGANEKIESKVTADNILPTILNEEVKVSAKTPTSLTIEARAEDADGDKLVYRLYVEKELKATSQEIASGAATTLTVNNLANYTEYTYYVTASDAYDTTTSESKVGKTQCPGGIAAECRGYCNRNGNMYPI